MEGGVLGLGIIHHAIEGRQADSAGEELGGTGMEKENRRRKGLTGAGGLGNVRPATVSLVLRWRNSLSMCLVLAGGIAAANPLELGASLGMLFPTDRLTRREGGMGASLLPGPAVGVCARSQPLDRFPRLSAELMVEAAFFQSDENRDLRLLYVPVQAVGLWGIGAVEGMEMLLRLGGGPTFLSANLGGARSLVAGMVTGGWQVRRRLEGLSCALETGADLVFDGKPEDMFRIRIVLMK